MPPATYNASCHCGAVAYRVTVSPPLDHSASSVSSCNCSICVRNGYLFIYVPSKDVEFEKGEGAMTVGLGFPFFSCCLLSLCSVFAPLSFSTILERGWGVAGKISEI